jgi:hypothetical protein
MTVDTFDIDLTEQPTFWIGMLGFSPERRASLGSSTSRAAAATNWRASAFQEADAWLVNGAQCRLLPDGKLRVAPSSPSERIVNLDWSVRWRSRCRSRRKA